MQICASLQQFIALYHEASQCWFWLIRQTVEKDDKGANSHSEQPPPLQERFHSPPKCISEFKTHISIGLPALENSVNFVTCVNWSSPWAWQLKDGTADAKTQEVKSLGWLKWVQRYLKFVTSSLKNCQYLLENYFLFINDKRTQILCLVFIIGVLCWGGKKHSSFNVTFLFDVKPLACDFTCNYPNACNLQNHFVWFSGHFPSVLHHLQICNFWDCRAVPHPCDSQNRATKHLRHPEQNQSHGA